MSSRQEKRSWRGGKSPNQTGAFLLPSSGRRKRPDIRLYVRATNLDDGTFEACEDTFWGSSSVQALALAAGRYHIDLAAKNVINGTLATWESDVVVPNYDKSFFRTMR